MVAVTQLSYAGITATVATDTQSITPTGGADSILVAFYVVRSGDYSGANDPDSIVFNTSEGFTEEVNANGSGSAFTDYTSELWTLDAPTATTADVVITLPFATQRWAWYVYEITGIDTATTAHSESFNNTASAPSFTGTPAAANAGAVLFFGGGTNQNPSADNSTVTMAETAENQIAELNAPDTWVGVSTDTGASASKTWAITPTTNDEWTGIVFSAAAAGGFTGSGAIAYPMASVAGVGAQTMVATGAISYPAVSVAGVGLQTFLGSGAIAYPIAAVVGTGAQTFSGTGTITYPIASVLGSGVALLSGEYHFHPFVADPAYIAAVPDAAPTYVAGAPAANPSYIAGVPSGSDSYVVGVPGSDDEYIYGEQP